MICRALFLIMSHEFHNYTCWMLSINLWWSYALSTFQKFPYKNRLPSLGSYVWIQLGKVVVHNYLVNAILSHYLTTSFYSFHMVGRVTKQKCSYFLHNMSCNMHSPHKKYGNALKIPYDKITPISKMLEVTMLMKEYDRRACRHPSCVKASPPENLCVLL